MNVTLSYALLAAAIIIANPTPYKRISHGVSQSRRTRPGFLMVCAVLTGACLFVLVGTVTSAVAASIVVGTVFLVVRAVRRKREAAKNAEILAHFYGAASADIRAGSTFSQAMHYAVHNLPVQGGQELKAELATAASLAQQGRMMSADTSTQLREFAQLLTIGQHYGVPLAGLVEQAQSRLDAQRRHAQATSSSLQGPQVTAVVLSILPLAGIGMGTMMGARPLEFLLGGGLGGILLVVGTALACGGFLWSQAIITSASGIKTGSEETKS